MRKSMLLLGVAAVGLAACGSKEDLKNLANTATETAQNAANTAESAAANAANTAENAAANATDTVGNAADTATETAKPPAKSGKPGAKVPLKLKLTNVAFKGCTSAGVEAKPGVCVLVRTGSGTYDISSAKVRPKVNRAISGTGIYLPNQQGICMAGKVLNGVKWNYIGGQCVKGKLQP